MKTWKTQFLILLLGIIIAFTGCEIADMKEVDSRLDLPLSPYNYQIGISNEIPTLGRVLFYDPRISANNTVSCASCHKQELAFSDNNRFSVGFNGKSTERNSMAIQNIVSTTFPAGVEVDATGTFKSTSLFWDGRQQDVVSMVIEPIQNHIEMGISDMDGLMNKIQSIPDYKPLFTSAYGSAEVNKDKVATALAAFVVSIRSNGSRFDLSNLGLAALDAQQLMGLELFFGKYNCNSCHQVQRPVNGYQFAQTNPDSVPTPGNQLVGFADIGLDQSPTDVGAFQATGRAEDKGKFKIPSLRNVALTAPYMHDGRFNTLDEVLGHYSGGIQNSENLDPNLRESHGVPKKLNITELEKAELIAFLKAMTDFDLIQDERFSNPFHVR
jgi:cytochrome c peroxidase